MNTVQPYSGRISLADVVREFDVSRSTLFRAIKSGKISKDTDSTVDISDCVNLFKPRKKTENDTVHEIEVRH